ncbi:uncharacterized protein LOC130749503 [Lotus japonicus]|uniref:uncharacterized protein LOC130749503 n=1 Tax=Lotus japonicus TaxID=34305 RepID=UPI00258A377F|nr:uncharacterized protein LOC130749503 [Lotus japonicus]
MELGASRRGSKFSSYERLAAIGLVILAVASPLYIGQQEESELEDEEQHVNIDVRLPLLLFLLILGIALSASMDRSFTAGFDRYWIHRVCGSSGGIFVILTVLFLILKCKSSL